MNHSVAVRLGDDRVLVIEGATDDLATEDTGTDVVVPGIARVYDPIHGGFSELRLLNPYYEFSATALLDGRVLIVGDGTTALVCAP
jgi:hypothetical protein